MKLQTKLNSQVLLSSFVLLDSNLLYCWMKSIKDFGNISSLGLDQLPQPASLILVPHARQLSKSLFHNFIRHLDIILGLDMQANNNNYYTTTHPF